MTRKVMGKCLACGEIVEGYVYKQMNGDFRFNPYKHANCENTRNHYDDSGVVYLATEDTAGTSQKEGEHDRL